MNPVPLPAFSSVRDLAASRTQAAGSAHVYALAGDAWLQPQFTHN